METLNTTTLTYRPAAGKLGMQSGLLPHSIAAIYRNI